MRFKLYSKNALLLGEWNEQTAALAAFRLWPQAYQLFDNCEIVATKED